MHRTVQPEVLTVAEAAQELRCSASTIKRWLRAGLISGIRTPTGRWLIPLAELRALRVHSDTGDRGESIDRRPIGMH